MRMRWVAIPILLLCIQAAHAENDEMARLRAELEQTRAIVEQLAARLDAMEAAAAATGMAATSESPPAPAPAATSANAFNPAVSVVLQGSYNAYSKDPGARTLPGFVPGDEVGQPNQGFSLGESELNFSASIDPLFNGSLTMALEDDGEGGTEIGLEEAYIETLALPHGVKIKAGRMFPVLGYLNEIHAHADAFVDRPLPYQAFLGGDNYVDDGVQLSLLLPTDFYAEIGGGAFRGTGFPAAGADEDGKGALTLFARTGGDIGLSQSWVAGLSFLHADAADRITGNLTFNGTIETCIADAKYTWAPGGNLAARYLVLQGEYLHNRTDGSYNGLPYDEDSSGWYAQLVYKLRPQWKVGYRYSALNPPEVAAAFSGTTLDHAGHRPRTQSLLLGFDYSEFSSLRFQYSRDRSGPQTDNIGMLFYTVSMGAHGAHQY